MPCPSCGQGVSFLGDRGRIRVICPSCKNEFKFPLPMPTNSLAGIDKQQVVRTDHALGHESSVSRGVDLSTGSLNSCPNCSQYTNPALRASWCDLCHKHVVVLRQFSSEFREGNFAIAEATIRRELKHVDLDGNKAVSNEGLGAAVLWGMVGTLVAPGVGTLLGASLGKSYGEKLAAEGIPSQLAWKYADLYFALGLIFKATGRAAEAHQAFVQALVLKEDHEPSRLALRGT